MHPDFLALPGGKEALAACGECGSELPTVFWGRAAPSQVRLCMPPPPPPPQRPHWLSCWRNVRQAGRSVAAGNTGPHALLACSCVHFMICGVNSARTLQRLGNDSRGCASLRAVAGVSRPSRRCKSLYGQTTTAAAGTPPPTEREAGGAAGKRRRLDLDTAVTAAQSKGSEVPAR